MRWLLAVAVQPSDEKVFHLLTVPVITNASTKPTPQNSALAIIQIARSGIEQHFTNVEVQALEELATLVTPVLSRRFLVPACYS